MTFELWIVLALVAGLVLPHLLPLHTVAPLSAAGIWLSALALRALAASGLAIFVFVYLPQTGLFDAVARWCWHIVIPLVAEHLGLSGHPLADAAAILPALVLASSAAWVLFAIAWAAINLHIHIGRRRRADGPFGATVVEDAGVVVAVAGLGRGRVVVSRRALAIMDAEEIKASVSHEDGHIRRRHRSLLLAGSVLAALGRGLPGTDRARRALAFSLERDADEFAVARTHNPLALASAICKAAGGDPGTAASPSLAGRGPVAVRLEHLLAGGRLRASEALERLAPALAVAMAALALLLTVTLPTWALAAPHPVAVALAPGDCHS